MKKSKDEVDYGKGHRGSKCGLCRHFETPNRCELVAGLIGRGMWCKLFEKKDD